MGKFGTAVDAIFDQCKNDPSLYRDLLPGLDPKITARRITLLCPSCGDRSGWLKPGDKTINCNHENNCGGKTHVLAALLGDRADILYGEQFNKAVALAAGIAGITIEDTGDHTDARKIDYSGLDLIWQVANEAIKDHDSDCFRYINRRGFHEDFIHATFGAISSLSNILAVVDSGTLKQFGFLDLRGDIVEAWKDRLIFRCFDVSGRLIGLIGRCIAAEPRSDKYRGTTGYLKAANPFGLQHARKHKRVILVEGHIDCLKLNQAGVMGVIAAGSCHLSADQLGLFGKHGIENLVCFFDADRAGIDGMTRALDAFDEQPVSPELFMGELPFGKDPDEYIDTFGVNPFLEVATRAIHAHRYRARLWFKDLERDGLGVLLDWQIPRYIERSARYLNDLKSARARLRATNTFLPEVCILSGVDRNDLKAVRLEFSRAAEKNSSNRRLIASLGSALARAREGDGENARALAAEVLNDTRGSKSSISGPEEALEELRTYFQRIGGRDLIGIKTSFRPFDENLLGARGLMLVAGGTNVGKTTLLGQLMTDTVLHTDDTCVLFLSFEMLRREINGRILSRLAGTDWRDLRRMFQPDFNDRSQYWEQALLEDVLRNTLIINPKTDRDFIFNVQSVADEINYLKERTGRKRCMVIIDYLDVVPGYEEQAGGNENIRQNYICDDMLSIKAIMGEDDPLIAITSVRKSEQKRDQEFLTFDDVMGSSRRVYCSDIVVIWNRFSDRLLYENCDLSDPTFPVLPFHEPQETEWEQVRKKPEIRTQLRRANEHLLRVGRGFSRLELVKVRDGMNKGAFNCTVNYRQNYIAESLVL